MDLPSAEPTIVPACLCSLLCASVPTASLARPCRGLCLRGDLCLPVNALSLLGQRQDVTEEALWERTGWLFASLLDHETLRANSTADSFSSFRNVWGFHGGRKACRSQEQRLWAGLGTGLSRSLFLQHHSRRVGKTQHVPWPLYLNAVMCHHCGEHLHFNVGLQSPEEGSASAGGVSCTVVALGGGHMTCLVTSPLGTGQGKPWEAPAKGASAFWGWLP